MSKSYELLKLVQRITGSPLAEPHLCAEIRWQHHDVGSVEKVTLTAMYEHASIKLNSEEIMA